MYPRTSHRLAATALAFSLSLVIYALAGGTCLAENSGTKLVVRDDVSSKHRAELLRRLSTITGWEDLRFEKDGALRWSSADFSGGSKSARSLLNQAAIGSAMIILEEASSRSDVAFCRVVPGRWIGNAPRQKRAFVVLIDFDDFHQVTGDQQARAAFDVGWGLLHELQHVVSDSEDAQTFGDVGECEDEINKMRFELGLPLRATYFFAPLPTKANPEFQSRLVRLAFEKHDDIANRKRRYWLIWDAAAVGGLTQAQTAVLR